MSELKLLSLEEIERCLVSRPLWKLHNTKLYRKFQAKSFHEAMEFMKRVGEISDEYHHHPNLHLTDYKTVEIELSTPRLNGITEMDIQMIDLFDRIPVEYSLLWKHAHKHLLPYITSLSSQSTDMTSSEERSTDLTPAAPDLTDGTDAFESSESSSAIEERKEQQKPRENVPHKYETVFRHQKHSPHNSFPFPVSSTVHSQPVSWEPGTVQHPKPFIVPTSPTTPLGKSDIHRHAEVSLSAHFLFLCLSDMILISLSFRFMLNRGQDRRLEQF